MQLGISAITHAFGKHKLNNIEECLLKGFEGDFIKKKVGIETRYSAGDEQATSDLAVEASRALLEKTNLKPSDIGLVVVITQTPDYQLPHTAALVQRELGLPKNVASFDVSLGCSGYVYGLSICISFMLANSIKNCLLITAETYTKIVDPSDGATFPLFSDGASATLINDDPIYLLGRGVFTTDGSGAERLIVRGGGSRQPNHKDYIYHDGRAIFSFMMTSVPRTIEDCLALNRITLNDVDLFVFHQANEFMLKSLGERLKLDPKKVVYAVRDFGNTVSSTIPIALEPLLSQRPGTILICGFGVGLSIATNTLFLNRRSSK